MKKFLPLLAAVGVLAIASGCCCGEKKDCRTPGHTAQCQDSQCGEEKKDAKDTGRKSAENSDQKQDCGKKPCPPAPESRIA